MLCALSLLANVKMSIVEWNQNGETRDSIGASHHIVYKGSGFDGLGTLGDVAAAAGG